MEKSSKKRIILKEIFNSLILIMLTAVLTGSVWIPSITSSYLQVETDPWRQNMPVEVRFNTLPSYAGHSVSFTLLTPSSNLTGPLNSRDPEFFGLSGVQLLWLNPEQQETDISLAVAAGAKAINLDFDWRKIEPTPDQFDWEETDRIFYLAKKYNIRIVPILMYTPLWASSAPYAPLDYFHSPPVNINDYRGFVYAVVNRYKPHQVNDYGIRDWVIWNEPNINSSLQAPLPGNFWTGSFEQYIQILQVGYEGAHAADPGCNVLNGALADIYWEEGKADLLTAVNRLYDPDGDGDTKDGGRPYFDILNIHLYQTGVPENSWYKERLETIIRIMERFGDENKPIWITETGFGSAINQDLESYYLSEEEQANSVQMVYDVTATYQQVERVFWWNLRDYYHDESATNINMEAHYGLIRANYNPKLAYFAYKQITGNLGQLFTFNTIVDGKGSASIVIPANEIYSTGDYVLFIGSKQFSGVTVRVYTVKP